MNILKMYIIRRKYSKINDIYKNLNKIKKS